VSEPDDLPEIHVPEDLRGGLWANLVLVTPGEDEITLDFVRLDPYAVRPGAGVVVARVALPRTPAMQLASALADALASLLQAELELDDDAED
jgi:hypothetical protein